METSGQHLLVEYHDCNSATLNNQDLLEGLFLEAAKAAHVTVIASKFHRFAPQGVSGILIIQESHLSLHSWPEYGYAAVDFYTCGEGKPELAHQVICKGLEAKKYELVMINRGESLPLRIVKHDQVTL